MERFIFDASSHTLVCGILNITPDSFSDGGKWDEPQKALEHALEMQALGADIIDVGAQSTRPGSTRLSADEENARLIPVLDLLKGRITVPISVDTFYPECARTAGHRSIFGLDAVFRDPAAGLLPRRYRAGGRGREHGRRHDVGVAKRQRGGRAI